MACQEERAEIAVTLVENGANLHIQNKVGDSNHESNRYLSLSAIFQVFTVSYTARLIT